MKLKSRDVGDVRVIDVEGRMVGGPEADDFQAEIRRSVEEGKTNVVLNLEGVSWIASPGAGMIFRAHSTLSEAGGKLKVSSLQDRVNAFFFTIRARQLVDVFEGEEDAVKSFAMEAEG